MGTLIIYGIIAAIGLGAIGLWHHSAVVEGQKEGIAKQLAADKPIIDTLKAQLEQSINQERAREAELATLRDAAVRQTAAVTDLTTRTATAIKAAREAAQAQQKSAAAFEAERARLQAIAAAKPEQKGAEDALKATDSTLDGALRSLRK